VTIKAQGFKTAIVKEVEVLVATPASVEVSLQVGAQNEEIQVTGAGEVLQTQSATVSNTITGRQITDLPFASRNALDLVLFLPGVSSPARPRQSTINGLPKGALNITLDGVNVQDNLLKSSDGFFTYIQPKTDAIEEVTVSTATPGSESSGEGGAQIKFITRGGTNSYNGSLYEYHRNPALNANYYFNNLQGLPRTRVILNQFGGRMGGPIIKDRAFFFVNYEEYRLPEAVARQKTILSTNAQSGLYTYTVASGPAAGTHTINLLQLAGVNGQTSTVDPTTSALLAQIRSSTSQGTVSSLADANLNQFNFINTDTQIRKFPTVRFDFNLTSKHHLENIYNYQNFNATLDILNNLDPAFPGFPNQGGQGSSRWSDSMALRSTLTPTIVNEARFALVGGTSRFGQGISAAQFANQGGFNLGINATGLGINSATVSTTPQKRNSPVQQFDDNVTWTRGNHSYNFGFSFTQVNYFSSQAVGGLVSPITFGVSAGDPANAFFTSDPVTGNLPVHPARSLLRQQPFMQF